MSNCKTSGASAQVAASSVADINNTDFQENKIITVFPQKRAIGSYEQNSAKNSFLREYLYGKAVQQGVFIPQGMVINISSPSTYSDEFKQLLGYVRKDIYGARVKDMFDLLVQNRALVEERVKNMKISDKDKSKILQLKTQFDQYYQVEANYNGEHFDLVNLSDEKAQNLAQISPEFAKFAQDEKENLKKHVAEFARREIEAVELAEAGKNSRTAVPVLGGVLGILLLKEVVQTLCNVSQNKKNPVEFLMEQKKLSREKVFQLVNPIKEMAKKCKGKRGFLPILGAVVGIIGTTLAGSVDDCSGAGKDWFQDRECFGDKTAGNIAGLSVAAGVGTSFAIAGVYEKARDVMIAKRIKAKALKKAAKQAGKIARFKHLRKIFRPSMAQRVIRGGRFAVAGALFGAIVASCTSGSSWMSMLGTSYLLGKNGDKLEEKNIISPEENTSAATYKNLIKYDAYYGKLKGIVPVMKNEDDEWEFNPFSDTVIGGVLGGLGLLTHPSAIVANTSFAGQGSSETITGCTYQYTGVSSRANKTEKMKQAHAANI